ncbi:MAG: hypothetical protein PVH19_14600 [Planctomycetia bacterium]|jgi:hypothetical protein
MKSKYFALLAIIALVGFTGCCSEGRCGLPFGGGLLGNDCCDECCDTGCCDTGCGETCCEEPARCGLLDRCCIPCRPAPEMGPMTGTVAYPYYTHRGPRDFLAKNPPSIGP